MNGGVNETEQRRANEESDPLLISPEGVPTRKSEVAGVISSSDPQSPF
jgi:hypothetical protein